MFTLTVFFKGFSGVYNHKYILYKKCKWSEVTAEIL